MFGCKVCKEKDRLVEELQKQLEWMRVDRGTPLLKKNYSASVSEPVNEEIVNEVLQMHETEDEEDILAMRQAGLLSAEDAQHALRRIGLDSIYAEP